MWILNCVKVPETSGKRWALKRKDASLITVLADEPCRGQLMVNRVWDRDRNKAHQKTYFCDKINWVNLRVEFRLDGSRVAGAESHYFSGISWAFVDKDKISGHATLLIPSLKEGNEEKVTCGRYKMRLGNLLLFLIGMKWVHVRL